MNSDTTLLNIKGLSKHFGKVSALSNVNLQLGSNELLVILGPVGAGKTTLLRCIAGLENPDSGDLLINGQSILTTPPALRDVALVFQNFSLYPEWSVRRNLEFPLKAPGRRLDKAEISARVQWAAKMLQIDSFLDKSASALSGGQMQRVAIGRAIVRRPKIFLLDEPLANLDAKLRETLRVQLVEMRRVMNTPMIYVTHDQTEALAMADRIAVLHQGTILQIGTPMDIYEKPQNTVIARLLGQPPINILQVLNNQGRWTTSDGWAIAPSNSKKVSATVGIRPEHVNITPDINGNGMVKVVQDMGPTIDLIVNVLSHTIHASLKKPRFLLAGDRVQINIQADHLHVW